MVVVGTFVIAFTIYPTSATLLLLGSSVPLLIAYALSRTRHYRSGAALGIFIFSLMPYVTIAVVADALTPELLLLSLTWLNLPILLASLFFSIRGTAVNAALINLSMLLTSRIDPRC